MRALAHVPSSAAAFDGIEESFSASLGRAGSGWPGAALLILCVLGFLWIRRETRRRPSQRSLEGRRAAALRAVAEEEAQATVRVNADVQVMVHVARGPAGAPDALVHTEQLGPGVVRFRSYAPAPHTDDRLDMEVNIGDREPLALHGRVVLVEPHEDPDGITHLDVDVALEETTPEAHERLMHFLAQEEQRGIATAHGERSRPRLEQTGQGPMGMKHSTQRPRAGRGGR
jgi:hypothetical protein